MLAGKRSRGVISTTDEPPKKRSRGRPPINIERRKKMAIIKSKYDVSIRIDAIKYDYLQTSLGFISKNRSSFEILV